LWLVSIRGDNYLHRRHLKGLWDARITNVQGEHEASLEVLMLTCFLIVTKRIMLTSFQVPYEEFVD
jgi:hypothetical protein